MRNWSKPSQQFMDLPKSDKEVIAELLAEAYKYEVTKIFRFLEGAVIDMADEYGHTSDPAAAIHQVVTTWYENRAEIEKEAK